MEVCSGFYCACKCALFRTFYSEVGFVFKLERITQKFPLLVMKNHKVTFVIESYC
jgi:hypothetical protein